MSLENYLAKGRRTQEEILWSFEKEEIEQLHSQLKEIGYGQYLRFFCDHYPDILQYVSITPSQRNQKKWTKRNDLPLIRFGALQVSSATASLLDGIDRIAYVVDRGSYREFHSVVAEGLLDVILRAPLSLFPFEGYSNPFSTK